MYGIYYFHSPVTFRLVSIHTRRIIWRSTGIWHEIKQVEYPSMDHVLPYRYGINQVFVVMFNGIVWLNTQLFTIHSKASSLQILDAIYFRRVSNGLWKKSLWRKWRMSASRVHLFVDVQLRGWVSKYLGITDVRREIPPF